MALYLPPQGASTLAPLTQLCPGLHGDGDARTRTVPWRALLLEDASRRYEVPVFQRPYCWTAALAEAWFDDGVTGAARGARAVGSVVTRARSDGVVVVIDGQQRLTTSLLVVAALRDAAEGLRRVAPPDSGEAFVLDDFVDECRKALVVGGGAPRPEGEGDRWAAARLEPSFFDRRAFHGVLDGAAAGGSDSPILAAKGALDARVAREVKRWRSGGCGAQLARLRALLGAALDGLTATHVEVVAAHADDSQLFIYFQERSLLGDAPRADADAGARGVKPRAADLVRNLLAAAFADLGPRLQDGVFRDLWLEPLERRLSARDLDALLGAFVGGGGGEGRFVSEFERAIDRRRAAVGADTALSVYARFVSRLAAIEADLRGDQPAAAGQGAAALVQMASLDDGTLTPAPTASNYARGAGAAVLRAAAERVLRDLAAFSAINRDS